MVIFVYVSIFLFKTLHETYISRVEAVESQSTASVDNIQEHELPKKSPSRYYMN